MNKMTEHADFAASDADTAPFRIERISVFNWGAFRGMHIADFDPEGSALVGDTGSGKTTLIDALMTVLVHTPLYNLASTGGHASNRDLSSYVRGNDGEANENGVPPYIDRQGKTVTGVMATMSNGYDSLHFGCILWFESASSAASDLKRVWICSEIKEQSLSDWLECFDDGGKSALATMQKQLAGFHTFAQKNAYSAYLRKYFEVGENAFLLLNRAAGLKQLDSVDAIFRDLVLEDQSAFDATANVIREFETLSSIYQELQIATRQRDALSPIRPLYEKYLAHCEQIDEHREVIRIAPAWFAMAGRSLYLNQMRVLEQQITENTERFNQAKKEIDRLDEQLDIHRQSYYALGGTTIEQVEDKIKTLQKFAQSVRRNAQQYQAIVKNIGLDETLSLSALSANQQKASAMLLEIESALQSSEQEQIQLAGSLAQSQRQSEDLKSKLAQARNAPDSNVPIEYQTFRSVLAQALNVTHSDLPFVAEMIEVKPQEKSWRGAIERALGGVRLRILVPDQYMSRALGFINQRHNNLHVMLSEVDSMKRATADFFSDGYLRKLNYKDHPYRDALKQILSKHDLHCVDSVEQLKTTPYSMTVEGSIAGKKGNFDKNDRKKLSDDWMTGFDNADQIAFLEASLAEAIHAYHASKTNYETCAADIARRNAQKIGLERLAEISFVDIDLSGVQADLVAAQERLKSLSDPGSDTAKAKAQYESTKKSLDAARDALARIQEKGGALNQQRLNAESAHQKCAEDIGDGLTDAALTLAQRYLPAHEQLEIDNLSSSAAQSERSLNDTIQSLIDRQTNTQVDLARQMSKAKAEDTGNLVNTGTSIEDVPVYLARLDTLLQEALPEKTQRFKTYLNQSSDQGVTQLLQDIQDNVSMIESRIEDLNKTLRNVDFKPGIVLQIACAPIRHASIEELKQAQASLRMLAITDNDGEKHYRALLQVIALLRTALDNRRRSDAKALLDPRYRLKFLVQLTDRTENKVISLSSGSKTGSGGEKELTASFVLISALGYTLCPMGATQPLFGTIIVDEAFSKSSRSASARLIKSMHAFGLRPLFVTPNKEMQLLKEHTRRAVVIKRRQGIGNPASLLSTTWQALEAHRKQRATAAT